jgi:hypothetical protein
MQYEYEVVKAYPLCHFYYWTAAGLNEQLVISGKQTHVREK